MDYESTMRLLRGRGQEGLLRYYEELNEEEQKALLAQIERLDFSVTEQLRRPQNLSGKGEILPIDGLKIVQIEAQKQAFYARGRECVRAGKVGAVLLAGGQGTRLGSDAPKGVYDIGVTRPVYIFQRLIENLLEVSKDCGAFPPLYIMTSEKNDRETKAFLKEHAYFGYPRQDVRFFMQDVAPCTDGEGNLLLEEKGRVATSPNGNGGWFSSMLRAGLGEDVERRGVEWLNVFAVDNVLQRIADPVFVGAAIESGVNCAAKVVCKACPEERVGVLCLEDGKPNIIEYYELTPEMAHARGENGDLLFTYGVILNYLFRYSKLKEIAQKQIPVHVVKKKIPYIDEQGEKVLPQTENGYKFETLILDMVKLMETCLPFEVEREKEFAPIKNKTGTDSVETARALLEKNGVVL